MAIRIPPKVAGTRTIGRRTVGIARHAVQKVINRIRKLRRPLPPGFRFDRLDTNAR